MVRIFIYIFLVYLTICSCSSKVADDFDLETYIESLNNISLPGDFLLKPGINDQIKKDTAYYGRYIKYSLSTDSSDIFSYIILHADSVQTKYITLINWKIFKKKGCFYDEKYSSFNLKVYKEKDNVVEEITNTVFVNNNINEDVAKVNIDCNKIKVEVGYDSIAFVLDNTKALFYWNGFRYQYLDNGDGALLSLNSCHDYCTDIDSIETNLHAYKQLDFRLPDTFIHVYTKYRTISKIKAELPDRGIYEFYYNNFPNEVTSQKNLFCCKVSRKNDTEFNFFERGVFTHRVTPNLDTIFVKSSFDLLFDDSKSIDIYNLSQKCLNMFSINNNVESYSVIQKINELIKIIDSEYATYNKAQRKFEDPGWPIYGVLTSYRKNGELKLLHSSYSLTDNEGANIYIYLDRGKVVSTKTMELSSVVHEVNDDGSQSISTLLSDDKERFYSNNSLIGWKDRPLFVNQEYSYTNDQYFAKIIPEVCFSKDMGEMEGEYPPSFWLEFSKSKLSISNFKKSWAGK